MASVSKNDVVRSWASSPAIKKKCDLHVTDCWRTLYQQVCRFCELVPLGAGHLYVRTYVHTHTHTHTTTLFYRWETEHNILNWKLTLCYVPLLRFTWPNYYWKKAAQLSGKHFEVKWKAWLTKQLVSTQRVIIMYKQIINLSPRPTLGREQDVTSMSEMWNIFNLSYPKGKKRP